ncbi:MAG: hypothetical protein WCW17_04295 [Patescibacteria group bacterium]
MKTVSLLELANAFGLPAATEEPTAQTKVPKPEKQPKLMVAVAAEPERPLPPREEWPIVPKGYVTIEIHDFVKPFEINLLSVIRPDETVIAFPEEDAGWYGDEDYFVNKAIRCTTIVEYGWEIIKGLIPKKGYRMTGGYAIVLPHEGRKLVPPPGIWLCDTPARIRTGEIKIDEKWESIYELNRGNLAWGPTERAKRGWEGFQDDFPYVRIDGERWHYHGSIPGFGEMITKMYDDRGDVVWDSARNTLIVKVPTDHIKFWIGAGGRNAKRIANQLELNRFEVKAKE